MVLKGLVICASGTLSMTRNEFKELVEENNGKFNATITKSVTHLVCDQSEFDNESSKVAKAQSYDIPIVSEDFINDSIEEGKLKNEDEYLFGKPATKKKKGANTTTGKNKRSAAAVDDNDDKSSDDDENTRKKPKKDGDSKIMKVVAKGQYPVDADCSCADNGKIYISSSGDAYTVTLNQTDVSHGTYGHNKFYIIQLVEAGAEEFVVFTKWGRVGNKGKTAEDVYSSIDDAIESFEKKFQSKTGNNWSNRANFKEKKGKYIIVEIDYSDAKDDDPKDGNSHVAPSQPVLSTLPARTQNLMKLIANVQVMNDTLKEFKIDLNKMPLGKISKKQIMTGYEILQSIQDAIEEGDDEELDELSSKFYSNIPHDFGRRRPPTIKTKDQLRTKIEMLETLTELEVSSTILEESKKRLMTHPMDAAYNSLRCELTPIDQLSDEYRMVEEFLHNTHAPTHNMYSLEVQDIFAVRREGEQEQYQKNKILGNRQLLWHGSRITNFIGILSKGLLIAPPSAPSTGYMFGKGIYFADMSSKSANYCFTTPTNNVGCMLLSEVALGNMYERLHADYITELPKGFHSTWGKGKTVPDEGGYRTVDDGLVFPMGKPTKAKIPTNSALLYNEFITYDVSQSYLKYLLVLKFNYKNSF